MADEVEAGIRQVRDVRGFPFELLDVIFAEITEAETVGRMDDGRRENFGDRKKEDVFRTPVCAATSCFDAGANGAETLRDYCCVTSQVPSSTEDPSAAVVDLYLPFIVLPVTVPCMRERSRVPPKSYSKVKSS